MHGTFHSYWQISEECAIYGKLIQNRAFSRKIIFSQFRGVTKTDFWNTHPNMEIEISNKMDVFFSRNWSVTPQKTEISEKFLDEFSKIRSTFCFISYGPYNMKCLSFYINFMLLCKKILKGWQTWYFQENKDISVRFIMEPYCKWPIFRQAFVSGEFGHIRGDCN